MGFWRAFWSEELNEFYVFTTLISRLFNKTLTFYTTTLNFSVLPLVEIDHVTRYCLFSVAPINAYWLFSLKI